MKTLKYWYITAVRKGEWRGCIAHGIVHGHQRLADGIKIHTSAVSTVTVERDMAMIRTKNSEYHCRLDEASFELFDERGRGLLPDFEKLREKYERRLEVPGQGDGALIVLDGEAEYYFVGAAYRCGGEVIEVRSPSVHLGMIQDSVLMGCFFEKSAYKPEFTWPRCPSAAAFPADAPGDGFVRRGDCGIVCLIPLCPFVSSRSVPLSHPALSLPLYQKSPAGGEAF